MQQRERNKRRNICRHAKQFRLTVDVENSISQTLECNRKQRQSRSFLQTDGLSETDKIRRSEIPNMWRGEAFLPEPTERRTDTERIEKVSNAVEYASSIRAIENEDAARCEVRMTCPNGTCRIWNMLKNIIKNNCIKLFICSNDFWKKTKPHSALS